jgi:hypothetical protein
MQQHLAGVGANRPETRLKVVVLPAPLGPISACTWPLPTVNDAPLHGADAAEMHVHALHHQHRAPCGAGSRKAGQRQALEDAAPAHRRAFFRRRPQPALDLVVDAHQAGGREEHEADEDEPNQNSQLAVQIENSSRNSR